MHENTIRYRLGRIEETIGIPVATDADAQLTAQLALLVLRLQGRLVDAGETHNDVDESVAARIGPVGEAAGMGLERNLFTLLDRAAARSPWSDRPVFHFAGETRTYAELRERSLRLANGLLSIGVAPGDRVAVLLGNRHEWPEALFAPRGHGRASACPSTSSCAPKSSRT